MFFPGVCNLQNVEQLKNYRDNSKKGTPAKEAYGIFLQAIFPEGKFSGNKNHPAENYRAQDGHFSETTKWHKLFILQKIR